MNNGFVRPLDAEVVVQRSGRRMERLDQKDAHYSPIDTPSWSPSGAVLE